MSERRHSGCSGAWGYDASSCESLPTTVRETGCYMVNTVCLTIPCLNEEQALRSNLPRLLRHLRTMPATRWEVVVVDNGSTDGTQEATRELRAQYGEVSLLVQPERGRGNAIRKAWRASQAGVLAYMDADMAVDLGQIATLVEPIVSGRADIVYGNRFDASSTVVRSRMRELLSRGYRRLARWALGPEIQDFQCGFKAIRAAWLEPLLGKARNGHWFFDTELLVWGAALGLRVQGIPVAWTDRDETRVRFAPTIVSDLILLARLRRALRASRPPCRQVGESAANGQN